MKTKSVVVEMADGRIEECISEVEARDFVARQFGEVVYAEQWDADGENDDGQRMERLLFWADEVSAENDPGLHSIGYLSRIA